MIGRVVEALVEVARPIILEMFNKDSCIASTRIAIDVLHYFGIVAVPMALSATIYNERAAQSLQQGEALAPVVNFQSALRANEQIGAWSVMIGTGISKQDSDNPTWAGHLVAVIPQSLLLIDLAIDQASRPSKGVVLEPFCLRVSDIDWWKGLSPIAEFSDIAGNVLVFDRCCPDPTGYLTSPNWSIPLEYQEDFRLVTDKVIEAIKTKLGL